MLIVHELFQRGQDLPVDEVVPGLDEGLDNYEKYESHQAENLRSLQAAPIAN
jgi:hypothetical protein